MTQIYYRHAQTTFPWQYIAVGSLGFWLSASLLLDLAILPALWTMGMMDSAGFAAAGYAIFWIFNRIELICAAAAVSAIWACGRMNDRSREIKLQSRVGSIILMAIACVYTFWLSPYMSSLSIDLNFFVDRPILPPQMNMMHSIYWVLEASKLGIIGLLLRHQLGSDDRYQN
jgi:hypothetical protein